MIKMFFVIDALINKVKASILGSIFATLIGVLGTISLLLYLEENTPGWNGQFWSRLNKADKQKEETPTPKKRSRKKGGDC